MQTCWDDVSVSDAHVHFFSPAFFAQLAAQTGEPADEIGRRLGWRIPEACADLAAAWIQELDKHGVAKAALIASIPGDEDSVAAAVRLHPRRFFGYFMTNPTAEDATARVEKALAYGLHGVCLFPAMHRYSMADSRVRPILETVASHPGTIVFVHCGVLSVGFRKKLGLPSPFDMRYSNPIDLHAVALDHAKVNFVVPHFGAGYFREVLMLADLCPNVYLDTSSSNSWMRFEAGDLDLKQTFRKALDVAGARRLLFGSDSSFFPRGWNAPVLEQQMQVLDDLNVSPEEAGLILGGNLERVLAR